VPCPDGDFYQSLRAGADVVTDTIATVTESGIVTSSGQVLDADVIVTATGLKLQLLGGTRLSVDDVPVVFSEKYMWNGVMLQDVPNLANVIGYTNASWTLGADTTATLVCRLLKHMDQRGQASAVPRVPKGLDLKPQEALNLSSTYIIKAKGTLPMAGNKAPFLPRGNYLSDYARAAYGNFTTGLEFGMKAKA
jgi:cation diffusion facilitator CzcD-associated flavoprotein CzcO